MAESTFILEFPKSQIELIAQLIHIHLDDGEDHPIGTSVLHTLIEQTNIVHKEATKHYVGKEVSSYRGGAKFSHSAWFIPLDEETKIYD